MNTIEVADLSAYMDAPDLTAKIRAAGGFAAELKAEFSDKPRGTGHPTMLAAKARGLAFRPGEVTVWAGYNGHRKSMFTSQVMLDLAVQKQRVLVASLEMAPVRTLARMTRQACGTAIPLPAEIDRFSAWSEGRLWLFDHVGKIDGDTCTALCRYFADTLRGHHVFIDSMMMVCGSEEHMDEQKQFVTSLCRMAVETGLHIHLIAHCRKPAAGDEQPPSKYDIKGTGAISDQAANVVTVWFNRKKAAAKNEAQPYDSLTPDALITVEKQRNGAWEGRLKFWFDDASLRFLAERMDSADPYPIGGINA
jgi:twinkle protein